MWGSVWVLCAVKASLLGQGLLGFAGMLQGHGLKGYSSPAGPCQLLATGSTALRGPASQGV